MEESSLWDKWNNRLSAYLNLVAPYSRTRWAVWWACLVTLLVRVLMNDTHEAILFLVACLILKYGVLFISPQGIPSIFEESNDEEFMLPSTSVNR